MKAKCCYYNEDCPICPKDETKDRTDNWEKVIENDIKDALENHPMVAAALTDVVIFRVRAQIQKASVCQRHNAKRRCIDCMIEWADRNGDDLSKG